LSFKRIIYALLYYEGIFQLSRNFKLQKVGNVNWFIEKFNFQETCNFIDELIIINIKKDSKLEDLNNFLKDIDFLKKKIFIPVTLGGRLKNLEKTKMCFNNGADKILLNSMAHEEISELNKITKVFGAQAVTIMVDYKKKKNNFFTFKNCGQKESMEINKYFKKIKNLNYGEIIFNSIDLDGTGSGLDTNLVKKIPKNFNKPILLMGGAGKPKHFSSALKIKKISGIVTANLFNFLGTGLKEVREYCLKKKINICKF